MAFEPIRLLDAFSLDLESQGYPDLGDPDFPGVTLGEFTANHARRNLLKKYAGSVRSDAGELAIQKFISVNNRCRDWTMPDYDTRTEMLLGEVKRSIWHFWNRASDIGPLPLCDSWEELLERGRPGPGSSVGSRGQCFYAKHMAGPITSSSPRLVHWYQHYIQRYPTWELAEEIRASEYGAPSIVESGKLSLVPKNDQIMRCITVEPSLNTFVQLGFGSILEERLVRFYGIDLAKQQFRNRMLARLGSITDGLSTIDLSSASDSISIKMLRMVIPPDFMSWLMALRTPKVEVKGRGTVDLHMVSTMGNGFTFPLQTMLFAAVVSACMRFSSRRKPTGPPWTDHLWGVFGDDIICPREVTRDVIKLLEILGFSVNRDKTFVEGPFRESCGADYFLGTNVRPVFLQEKLDRPQTIYSAVNRLVRFSTKSKLALPRTFRYLFSLFRETVLFVPRSFDLGSGLHVPWYVARGRVGYSKSSQSPIAEFLRVNPRRIRVTDHGLVVPRGHKSLIFNPSGLLMSLLYGEVNGSNIGVRENFPRWHRRRVVVPNWDYHPCHVRTSDDAELDWRRWESVVSVLEIGGETGG